jgi:hypothetical protein
MAVASVSSGTPDGLTWRSRAEPSGVAWPSRARRLSREMTRATIATAEGGGLVFDPGDAIQHELGEEGVEVGEVPVQDTLGETCLDGDRAAGQRVRPVSEQNALGGVEQLLTGVADGGVVRRGRRTL